MDEASSNIMQNFKTQLNFLLLKKNPNNPVNKNLCQFLGYNHKKWSKTEITAQSPTLR